MGLRNYLRDIYWLAKGPFLPNSKCLSAGLGPFPEIIFVCKGNICRSAFAEAYALDLVRTTMGLELINITSGGLDALDPTMPPNEALEAAETFGISLAHHRSRPIPLPATASSSLYIAMEWAHIASLQCQANWNTKQRIYPLASFDPFSYKLIGFDRFNIRDPYGKSVGDFIQCFDRITHSVKALFTCIADCDNS